MAWFIECPFCHKSVFRWFYSWHEKGHTARRPDGQMNEHVTLAPEERFEGSLEGIPQAYRHSKCGVVTGMPEEIIRTYLVAPLTYNDSSFCCGCGDYVVGSELIWIDTGESVMGYMSRLRAEHLQSKFGIDPAACEIVLTPGTPEAIHSIVMQQRLPTPFYLALEMVQREQDVHYKVDIAHERDPKIEDIIELPGIQVLIRKDQRKRLKGTLIHFQNTPGRTGFIVARLRPWD